MRKFYRQYVVCDKVREYPDFDKALDRKRAFRCGCYGTLSKLEVTCPWHQKNNSLPLVPPHTILGPSIRCKRCGLEVQRRANAMAYCSEECRSRARRDYMRHYMRGRRQIVVHKMKFRSEEQMYGIIKKHFEDQHYRVVTDSPRGTDVKFRSLKGWCIDVVAVKREPDTEPNVEHRVLVESSARRSVWRNCADGHSCLVTLKEDKAKDCTELLYFNE